MSTDDDRIKGIIDDILANAKNEADKVLAEAKKQVKEITNKAGEAAAKEKTEIIETDSKTINELEKQQIASINLQARREILQKKEDEIKKVFKLTENELANIIKKESYVKILEDLIIEAGITMGGGNLVVKIRKEDKNALKDLTSIAKEISKKCNEKCSLKLSTNFIEVIGGAIIQTEDEAITIDNTFEALLEQKYKAIRIKIAKILFEKAK